MPDSLGKALKWGEEAAGNPLLDVIPTFRELKRLEKGK